MTNWNINNIKPKTEEKYEMVYERFLNLMETSPNSAFLPRNYFYSVIQREFGYKSASHVSKIVNYFEKR